MINQKDMIKLKLVNYFIFPIVILFITIILLAVGDLEENDHRTS
jgi:hypothetical protein